MQLFVLQIINVHLKYYKIQAFVTFEDHGYILFEIFFVVSELYFSVNQGKYKLNRIVEEELIIFRVNAKNKNFKNIHERNHFHGICKLFLNVDSYFRSMMKFETNITQYLKIYHNKNRLNTL